MAKKAVIHNIALAFNSPTNTDPNEIAGEVIEAINSVLRATSFGLLDPHIISSKHPVSLVVDQDDEALALTMANID